MKPFEESEESEKIHSYFASLKRTPAKIREGELPALAAITNHKDFAKIASSFTAIEDYYGCVLTTADKPFILLKLAEMEARREEDERLKDKMHQSI